MRIENRQIRIREHGHLHEDAVIVLRIPLNDHERFAAALRGAEVVAVTDGPIVEKLHERDRHVVRLLHLRVQEVAQRLVVGHPRGRRWERQRAARRRRALHQQGHRPDRGPAAAGGAF